MPMTVKNYFRYSDAALETALTVLPDNSDLYELVQDELFKREEYREENSWRDVRDNTYESTYQW